MPRPETEGGFLVFLPDGFLGRVALEWVFNAVLGYTFLLLLIGLLLCIRGLPRWLLARDPKASTREDEKRENGLP